MKNPRQRWSSAWLLPLLVVACGGEPRSAPAPEAASIGTLTVEAGAPGEGRIRDGVVEATHSAVLSAQTSGRIAVVTVDVDDPVAAGQVLARITATEQAAAADTARAQLRAAEAQAGEAGSRFRRADDLVGRQLISRQDFEQVRAARDSAVAARDAAAAQLALAVEQLAYTTVRAPYAGVVGRRHVDPGEAVSPGARLFELYAPQELRVAVQVAQGDAPAIRAAPRARVQRLDGSWVEAARVVVHPGADPLTHSVTVRVQLPEGAGPLRPGETVKVAFPGIVDSPAVWIPAATVQRRGELTAVYVLHEGALLLRQLRLGRTLGDRVEVIAGLAPGEQVARDPVAALEQITARRAGRTGADE